MAPKATSQTDALAEHTVVDCDVHCAYRTPELRNKIADRLEEPYRTHLLRETRSYGPYPRDSFPKGTVGEDASAEGLVETPADIQADLIEGMGVDVPILNSLQKFDLIPSSERAVREMSAVNQTFIEHFLDGTDSYGLGMLTTQRPERAAEEIDTLATEDAIVGVMLLNGASEKPLGHPRYDVIYRAAADHGLPVVFHTSALGYTLNRKFPFLFNDVERYATLHTLAHPYANMATIASLIVNGVPEKFPELAFVCLELGLGTVPLMMHRLNREVRDKPYDAPLLEQSPEAYLRDRFYFGTQPLPEPDDARHARQIIDMIGTENLLFTTDHPHPDFDDPGWVVNKYFGHLDDDELAAVLGGNAIELFDLAL